MNDATGRIAFGLAAVTPLSLLAVWPWLAFPYMVGPSVAFRCLILLAVVVWAVAAWLHPAYRPRATPVSLGITALVGASFLSSAFAPNGSLSTWGNLERMGGSASLLWFGALVLAVSSLASDDRRRRTLLAVLVLTGCLISMIALLQFAGIPPFARQPRPASLLGNPDYLGIFALLTAFAALVLCRYDRRWLTPALLCTAAMVVSGSRGALVGFVAGLLTAAFACGGWWRRTAVMATVGIAVTAVVILGAAGTKALEPQLGYGNLGAHSVLARLAVWRSVGPVALQNPVLGTGEDSLPSVIERIPIAGINASPWFDRAHDWVLDRFVSGGVIGLAAYIALFAAAFGAAWKRADRPFWLGLIAAYLIANLFWFDGLASFLPLAICLGVLDSTVEQRVVLRAAPALACAACLLAFPATAEATLNAHDALQAMIADGPASIAAFDHVAMRGGPGLTDATRLLAAKAAGSNDLILVAYAVRQEEANIALNGFHARDALALIVLLQIENREAP